MKKYLKAHLVDLLIIAGLVIVALVSLIIINSIEKKDNTKAEVYLKGELVLVVDLSKETDEREIVINEHITLMVKKGAIKVKDNDCPSQYCVNQGYTSSLSRPIICAYHGLYIKITSNEEDVDVVVG